MSGLVRMAHSLGYFIEHGYDSWVNNTEIYQYQSFLKLAEILIQIYFRKRLGGIYSLLTCTTYSGKGFLLNCHLILRQLIKMFVINASHTAHIWKMRVTYRLSIPSMAKLWNNEGNYKSRMTKWGAKTSSVNVGNLDWKSEISSNI